MKKRAMDSASCEEFLQMSPPVGRFTTVDHGGAPYTVPVHYVYLDGTIYIHGSTCGKKGQNVLANPKACFEIDEMEGLASFRGGRRLHGKHNLPQCHCLRRGPASLTTGRKNGKALDAIVAKLTPVYKGTALPDKKVETTGVIALRADEISGKQFPNAT